MLELIPIIAMGGAAFVVVAILLWIISRRRVVPTNMTHIVQRSKRTTLYGSGLEAGNVYYHWPKSMPIIGIEVSIFQGSIFDITLKDYEAYDDGRLPFKVDVKAFFRVEDADTAAKRVSTFAELQQQLTAVLQGAVRRILATNKLEAIMQDRSKLGDEFTKEVNDQLAAWGVTTVKSIEFMDIRDSEGSEVIANIMEKEKSRIERDSREAVAENNRAAEEKEIEAQRQVDLQRQDAEQQVGIRTAEKEREVGIKDEESKQAVLEQARETASRTMAVKQIEDVRAAEIAREVAVVAADKEKQVTIVKAEAAKEQTVIAADAKKTETTTIAQGQLAATLNEADGVKALGDAKAAAEAALLLAPVTAQITLAEKIAELPTYQTYLKDIRQIEAGQVVGTHMAEAIGKADLKVISNSGDPVSGVVGIGDLFGANGGTRLTGMLTALSQTEEGKALVSRLTGDKGGATPPAVPN